MSGRILTPAPCDCCGAEFHRNGVLRGYQCSCDMVDSCEVCKFCKKDCRCTQEMRVAGVVARADYDEVLRTIRSKHPDQVNRRFPL